jgi:hypothetical protein
MDESMQNEQNEPDRANPSASNSDASFLGWQEMSSGETFAFYNVTAADHPSFGSTVTEKSLKKLGLQVPDAPLPQGFVMKPQSPEKKKH